MGIRTTHHAKSWSETKRKLEGFLCEKLRGRISYNVTMYRKAHDSPGRASILLDRRELASFSWSNSHIRWKIEKELQAVSDYESSSRALAARTERECLYSYGDFLIAASHFLQMPIAEAIESPDSIVRIFAIMDRRVGKRSLLKIMDSKEYLDYPDWVRQFYKLRFECEGLNTNRI